jgi:hypothetical protein
MLQQAITENDISMLFGLEQKTRLIGRALTFKIFDKSNL